MTDFNVKDAIEKAKNDPDSVGREYYRLAQKRIELSNELLSKSDQLAAKDKRIAELEAALRVPDIWGQEETDGMVKAFQDNYGKHGLRETLFSVAASVLRSRCRRAKEILEAD